MNPLVSIEELSRYMDGQVSDEEAASIEQRLEECPLSRAMKEAFERLMNRVGIAVLTSAPAAPGNPGGDCLDESLILKVVDGSLSPVDRTSIEEHMLTCEKCLALVLQNLRTAHRMRAGRWPEIPEAVLQQTAMRSLVNTKERPPEEAWESASFTPSEMPEAACTFGRGDIAATLVLAALPRAGAKLDITVKEHLRSLAGMEVVITDADSHRKVFTGRTNAHGRVSINRLPTGRYQIHFPSSELKIELTIEE